MNAIDFKALPVAAKVAITWSFFWRALLIGIASTLCSGLAGGIVGFMMGMVLGAAGFPIEAIQFFGAILGFVIGVTIGFLFFMLYIQWLLSSRLGQFRLLLVRANEGALPAMR